MVASADQARLVGVEDSAGAVPDLHAHDAFVTESALLDDAVDGGERTRIAVREPIRDGGLDSSVCEELRLVLRVAYRLGRSSATPRSQSRVVSTANRLGDFVSGIRLGHVWGLVRLVTATEGVPRELIGIIEGMQEFTIRLENRVLLRIKISPNTRIAL